MNRAIGHNGRVAGITFIHPREIGPTPGRGSIRHHPTGPGRRLSHLWSKGFATLWLDTLDARPRAQIVGAVDRLAESGPGLGRPLVDKLGGSRIHNLKELRPGSAGRSEIRILFVFDPWRSAILLVGGDKSGDWSGWYRRAIPRAEELYGEYLKEREAEEKDR
ncbi:type II toxin-antitoxin system RelE/ParE family toxin [Microtetraspora fusca]|uniref:type II toxin-antitoxin system RelE/ParE family toxin n=1 Tax=Microtetraspora fusca TaxID=1997 RepID=UPI000A02F0DD|nr:type II toxin-antitoxin system RelE/ParE family toxin [Microtetraspora fusca]